MAETYEGRPCKWCGTTTRYSANGNCVGIRSHPPNIEYERVNKEHIRQLGRNQRLLNPEHTKRVDRECYQASIEYYRMYQREYYYANRERIILQKRINREKAKRQAASP